MSEQELVLKGPNVSHSNSRSPSSELGCRSTGCPLPSWFSLCIFLIAPCSRQRPVSMEPWKQIHETHFTLPNSFPPFSKYIIKSSIIYANQINGKYFHSRTIRAEVKQCLSLVVTRQSLVPVTSTTRQAPHCTLLSGARRFFSSAKYSMAPNLCG